MTVADLTSCSPTARRSGRILWDRPVDAPASGERPRHGHGPAGHEPPSPAAVTTLGAERVYRAVPHRRSDGGRPPCSTTSSRSSPTRESRPRPQHRGRRPGGDPDRSVEPLALGSCRIRRCHVWPAGGGGGVLGTLVGDIGSLFSGFWAGGGGPGYVINGPIAGGLSGAASTLTSDLNNLGVITSPVTASTTNPPTSSNPLIAQLQTDQQALQTEFQALSTRSGVTVADLTQLVDRQLRRWARPSAGSARRHSSSALTDLAAAPPAAPP